jgi:uncharacterized protein
MANVFLKMSKELIMIKRTTFLLLGHMFFSIGTLGIILPVLPTIPFYLLALGCYCRSSQKLHDAMLSSKLYGPALRDWKQNRSISTRSKILAILTIAVSITVSVYFLPLLPIKVLLVVIGFSVSLYIATRPKPVIQVGLKLADESS